MDKDQGNKRVAADYVKKEGDKGGTNNHQKNSNILVTGKLSGIGKNNPKYWESRVKKIVRKKGKDRNEDRHYSARIGYKGQQRTFPLGTGNKAAAGKEAARIYLFLVANGWAATRERFSPAYAPKSDKPVTVGEYIKEAEKIAEVPEDTLRSYVATFRSIVADIAGIDSTVLVEEGKRIKDKESGKCRNIKVQRRKDIRYDYVTGQGKKWRSRVDAIKLAKITPAKVQKWKIDYVRSKTGDDLEEERRSKNSANSKLRQAKGLFSAKILPYVRKTLTLPGELPFDGVKPFPRQSMRYVSKIDAPELIRAAVNTLAESEPEAFKIFLLGLMAGLRAKEIDALLWRQIDLDAGTITIEATPYFRPKSEDSIASVEIEPETAEILRGFRARAKGEFVIESGRAPKERRSRERRAKKEFAALNEWLKDRGVTAQKPVHELRKEFGSLVCQNGGLYAASRALRHADVAITAAHYLDKKERVTVGLGAFLSGDKEPEGDNVTPIEKGREETV